MDNIFDLDSILLNLDKKGNSAYFLDFLHNNSFEVGRVEAQSRSKGHTGTSFRRRTLYCYGR